MISTAITTVILAAFVIMLVYASYLWDERERLEGQLDEIEQWVINQRNVHSLADLPVEKGRQLALRMAQGKIRRVRRE